MHPRRTYTRTAHMHMRRTYARTARTQTHLMYLANSRICTPLAATLRQMAREAVSALLHMVMASSIAMVPIPEWGLTMSLCEVMLKEQVVANGQRNGSSLDATQASICTPSSRTPRPRAHKNARTERTACICTPLRKHALLWHGIMLAFQASPTSKQCMLAWIMVSKLTLMPYERLWPIKMKTGDQRGSLTSLKVSLYAHATCTCTPHPICTPTLIYTPRICMPRRRMPSRNAC